MEKALKRIEKSDSAVLNQLLRIYFKALPEEMETTRKMNRPLLKVRIKYVDRPQYLAHPSYKISEYPRFGNYRIVSWARIIVALSSLGSVYVFKSKSRPMLVRSTFE